MGFATSALSDIDQIENDMRGAENLREILEDLEAIPDVTSGTGKAKMIQLREEMNELAGIPPE
jgi:hypothetical protein